MSAFDIVINFFSPNSSMPLLCLFSFRSNILYNDKKFHCVSMVIWRRNVQDDQCNLKVGY